MIVSFRRSGTHLLAELLFRNLETGAKSAEELHFSHSTLPDFPYVCVWRPILPTALSFWRMRERFGLAKSVTFSQMVQEPWAHLEKCEDASALLNGVFVSQATKQLDFGSFCEAWLNDTQRFVANSRIHVRYSALVERPYDVVREIAREMRLKRRSSEFQLVHERVGWAAVHEEQPVVQEADLLKLSRTEAMLRGVR